MAIGLFTVIAGAGLTGFIPVLQQNRQSGEILRANRLAEEGLEAVRSIRNRDFSLITSGTKGVGVSSNLWSFSGTSDVTDKYNRQIIIEAGNRDSGGTLVGSGTTDPDTWLVKSKVTWNYSVGETKEFTLDTVLTNWRKTIGGVNYDGLMVYTDGTTSPPWRSYTTSSNSFGNETTMPSLTGSPRNMVVRTSPAKTEAIVGAATSTGVLYIYCFDGNTWTQDWSVTVGGTATTKRFDIAYENTTGKAVVLYSTNTGTTNELAFRTKSGSTGCGSSNWSGATNFDPLRTAGIVQWIKMASDPRAGSDLISAIWADGASDLSAAVWNKTTFVNEPSAATETSLEIVAAAQDVDDFDLAYESLSGDLMVVWANSSGANGVNGVRYRTCTGGVVNCTWGTVTTPPTFADDATNLDLSANPNSDEMVFASIGNAGSDLQIGYWSGSAWTNRANTDNSSGTPLAGTKLVANGWLINGATARYIVTYMDSGTPTGISWYVGTAAGAPAKQADFAASPPIGAPKKWMEVFTNPKDKSQLMSVISDPNMDLFAKRLAMTNGAVFTWTNSDGGALELNLGQSTVKPFGFAWWQK